MLLVYISDSKKLMNACFEERCDALPFGEAERLRLLGFSNTQRKLESLGALLALEGLLALSGTPPMPIKRTAFGKPYFDGLEVPNFSLCHTDGYSAAVLSKGTGNIGIDMEFTDRSVDCQRLAKRFFSSAELIEYDKLSDGHTFFELWTRKEAYAKLCGHGLADILSQGSPTDNICYFTKDITLDGRCAVMSICTSIPCEQIQIFLDGVRIWISE